MRNFLLESAIWTGDFFNYVNQNDGVVQRGRIQMKIQTDGPDSATQWNRFIRPDGTSTDYQGEAKLKIEGNRVINPEPPAEDVNTGNAIEDYQFNGYIGEGHVHILEEYAEVIPGGERETRRNELHYCRLAVDQVLQVASVYVNGRLLVFANSRLTKE